MVNRALLLRTHVRAVIVTALLLPSLLFAVPARAEPPVAKVTKVLLPRTVVTKYAQAWVSSEFRKVQPGMIAVTTKLGYAGDPGDCRPQDNQYHVTVSGRTNSGEPYLETGSLGVGVSAGTMFDITEVGNYQVKVGINGGCDDFPFRLEVEVIWRS